MFDEKVSVDQYTSERTPTLNVLKF